MAGGRPTVYNIDVASQICGRIAQGQSLKEICRDDGMPCTSTVFKWLAEKPEFSDLYAQAREAQADVLADEIIAISDDGTNDWMERQNENGDSLGWVLNGEHVQRSKLRVDARKWIASKLKPKKYGERVVNEHTGKDGGPISFVFNTEDQGVL